MKQGFRGVIASASLKRGHGCRVAGHHAKGIPRRDCLGLIEAVSSRRRPSGCRRRRFRGVIASASLKHLGPRVVVTPEGDDSEA